MEYNREKREITLERELNELDKFALEFTSIVKKYSDYAIVSGYVSILLGRARATEGIDIFIEKIPKEKFFILFKELKRKGFECLNTLKADKAFSYLQDRLAIRFSRKKTAIPNFEVKFPKKEVEKEALNDSIMVILPAGRLKISSLERQIAFKKYYLKSDKDVEDAFHIEELFRGKIDFGKIEKLRKEIKNEK